MLQPFRGWPRRLFDAEVEGDHVPGMGNAPGAFAIRARPSAFFLRGKLRGFLSFGGFGKIALGGHQGNGQKARPVFQDWAAVLTEIPARPSVGCFPRSFATASGASMRRVGRPLAAIGMIHIAEGGLADPANIQRPVPGQAGDACHFAHKRDMLMAFDIGTGRQRQGREVGVGVVRIIESKPDAGAGEGGNARGPPLRLETSNHGQGRRRQEVFLGAIGFPEEDVALQPFCFPLFRSGSDRDLCRAGLLGLLEIGLEAFHECGRRHALAHRCSLSFVRLLPRPF